MFIISNCRRKSCWLTTDFEGKPLWDSKSLQFCLAESIWGNKIYLLFPSSLNTDGAGGRNPPLGRHWPIYPVWLISWLLMPWRLTSPGHQKPRFRPILTKILKYFGFVTRWVKRKIPKSLEYNNSLTSQTQLDESTARRQLKSPQSLSGRSIPLVTFVAWSSINMFAFRFVAIGPFLAEI